MQQTNKTILILPFFIHDEPVRFGEGGNPIQSVQSSALNVYKSDSRAWAKPFGNRRQSSDPFCTPTTSNNTSNTNNNKATTTINFNQPLTSSLLALKSPAPSSRSQWQYARGRRRRRAIRPKSKVASWTSVALPHAGKRADRVAPGERGIESSLRRLPFGVLYCQQSAGLATTV